ncbi:retinol dehydrogenase 8 [Zonotrichia albicollis]|uniref:retinol dehydrogenase 8 n=1 Tax=Zonotrichia albicollis TaxID=44394 RepID=UPI003D80E6EE
MATPPCRTVLVTGCSSGIGLAVAVLLARDPQRRYLVVATMRDLSRRGPLEAAAGAALGDTLRILRLDVTSDSSVAECLQQIPGGRVDVVVNNAGVGLVGPLEGASGPQVQRVFDTNVFGVLRLLQALLPQMKRRRSGHIVVVSSVMGLQGVVFNDVYAASKFAVEGLCESLAVQLLQFNVFVSLVEPGPVKHGIRAQGSAGGGKNPNFLARMLRRCVISARFICLPAGCVQNLRPEPRGGGAGHRVGDRSPPGPHSGPPTNPLYSPLLALRFADPSGDLGVRTFQRLLFDLGAPLPPEPGAAALPQLPLLAAAASPPVEGTPNRGVGAKFGRKSG